MGRDRVVIFVAQGFGLGRVPAAPGTLGSIGGVGWFALLIWASSGVVFFTAAVAGIFVAVLVGGMAEEALQQKDPGSIVLDEIIAIPICFAGWISVNWSREGQFPGIEVFFSHGGWWKTCAIFLAFRFFDIIKPWPVRQAQDLPGGWGLTADDVLAAGYVNACVLAAMWTGVW